MTRQVTCECGYVARADSDEDVTSDIREHIRSDHPELDDKVTDDQIVSWIELVS